MIAANNMGQSGSVRRPATTEAGERKRRSHQVVEVRVTVDVKLPDWLQAMQPNGSALAGQMQNIATTAAAAVMQQRGLTPSRSPEHNADPPRGFMEENAVPNQDVGGSAFVLTSSEPMNPVEVVRTETSEKSVEAKSIPGQTLLEVYDTNLRAKRSRSAGKKAIAEHLSSCRSFDEFCRAKIPLRCTEPKGYFTETKDLLQSYAAWSIVEKDLSRATTNRRVDHILMIAREVYQLKLDRPTEKELKKLEDSKQKKATDGRRIPSFEEVNSLATAVSVARWPYRSHAPYFWRGLIRLAAFIGFRTYDIVSLIPEKTGLCKEDVIWDTLCPVADVNNALGYELHSPHGWLHYAVKKDTHSDCGRILIPMPSWLKDWVRFFFEKSAHPERIFPAMKQDALDSKAFGITWQRIVKQAGVDPRIKISEGSGDVIAIRKYAANWWTLAAIRSKTHAAMADKISHYVLHHAEVTTATKHYLSTQAAVLPVMLELLSSWPVPAADATHVSLLPE